MLGGCEVLVVVAGSFSDAYNSSYAFFRFSVAFHLSHTTRKLSKLYTCTK